MLKFLLNQNTLIFILDILLVALILNRLFKLLQGTKGIFFLNGIIILYFATVASDFLKLKYLGLLLQWMMYVLIVGLPIIFQPELKRALETLGRKNPIIKWFVKSPVIAVESIDIAASAAERLSQQKIGALIVFEREDLLPVVRESGSYIDAILSRIMIQQVFYPNSPLHDGAIVIKGNRILAAGCFLPLDNQLPLPQELGSRHRAGLTLSTQSDAIVIIVSEETGDISLAYNGVLNSGFNYERLKTTLRELIYPSQTKGVGASPRAAKANKEVS
ncbi:MAG: diadenylate cyclase CdaA [Firmicutes bacterium]|nr:diadenylate cyclase CdaA [Bacillota bacterium]